LLQDGRRVAAAAKRRIQINSARANVERTEHFLEKHRHVLEHPLTHTFVRVVRVQIRAAQRRDTPGTFPLGVVANRIPCTASSDVTGLDHNDRDSSSGGSSSADSSAFSHCSRLSFHNASSHSSNRFPWPISIAARVRPAYSRRLGGIRIRPLLSRSRSVA